MQLPIEMKVLDHGYVALTDVMGDDRTPSRTARTSFRNKEEKTEEQDRKLTDYLIRNKHNTPLEFCQVRFYMKMPIFVARQLVRHRTSSINEISYRYIKAVREFYIPEDFRMNKQSADNKQGSSLEVVSDPVGLKSIMHYACSVSFDAYDNLLSGGLASELARIVLPLGTYTEWFWQCDFHNFLHMLSLRLDPHAQYEIRVYAEAMLALARQAFPLIIDSWEKSRLVVIVKGI